MSLKKEDKVQTGSDMDMISTMVMANVTTEDKH